MRSLISDSALPAGHSRRCFPNLFWQKRLTETPESVWAIFPLFGLLELLSVNWHTCSVESSVWPIQDLPRPVFCIPLCLSRLHGLPAWVVGIFYGTEVCFDLSAFCLVCIGGRSSINLQQQPPKQSKSKNKVKN